MTEPRFELWRTRGTSRELVPIAILAMTAFAGLVAFRGPSASADVPPSSRQPGVSIRVAPPTITAGDPVIVGAGDIARCDNLQNAQNTAALLSNVLAANPSAKVFTGGDEAYDSSDPQLGASTYGFTHCYDSTWGQFKNNTIPVPGDHEYNIGPRGTPTPPSSPLPYYNYFGASAGDPTKGYYSFDLSGSSANWHVVVLNTNSSCQVVGCGAGSPQEQWLRGDLAANQDKNVLAIMHQPRYSSGPHGHEMCGGQLCADVLFRALWQALYEYGADIVLSGHDHDYERFAPQDADWHVDQTYGVRQFVIGTGGANLSGTGTRWGSSEVYQVGTYGVLKLTLHQSSYDWEFIPVPGSSFTDSGSYPTHGPPSGSGTQTPTPSRTSTLTPSGTPTSSSTPSLTPSNTPSVPPTNTASATPSITPSNTPSGTPSTTPTNTLTTTPTGVPSSSPTNTPTGTRSPTSTNTAVSTSTSTSTVIVPTVTSTPTGPVPTQTATATGTVATSTPSPTQPAATGTPTETPTGLAATATATATGPVPTASETAQPGTATATATTTGVATATSTPPTGCTISFSDVPPGSPFYTFIQNLACRGFISGYADGTFRPYNNVTRGQISKIVSNAAGFNESVSGQHFEDVPPNSAFYEYVERMSQRGIISGYDCGSAGEPCVAPENRPYFRPNNNATRGQIAKIVVNTAVDRLGWTLLAPTTSTFQDVPVGSAFYEYIETAYSHQVLSGYDCGSLGEPCIPPDNRLYFRPYTNATRGQSSKIVSNTFFPAPSR